MTRSSHPGQTLPTAEASRTGAMSRTSRCLGYLATAAALGLATATLLPWASGNLVVHAGTMHVNGPGRSITGAGIGDWTGLLTLAVALVAAILAGSGVVRGSPRLVVLAAIPAMATLVVILIFLARYQAEVDQLQRETDALPDFIRAHAAISLGLDAGWYLAVALAVVVILAANGAMFTARFGSPVVAAGE